MTWGGWRHAIGGRYLHAAGNLSMILNDARVAAPACGLSYKAEDFDSHAAVLLTIGRITTCQETAER